MWYFLCLFAVYNVAAVNNTDHLDTQTEQTLGGQTISPFLENQTDIESHYNLSSTMDEVQSFVKMFPSTHGARQMLEYGYRVYSTLLYILERICTPTILCVGTFSNTLVCVVLVGRDMAAQDLSLVILAGKFSFFNCIYCK